MSYYIYFLLDKGKIVYVGQSGDVRARASSHKRNKIFDSVREIKCHITRLNHYEKRWIDRFKPKYNRTSQSASKKNYLRIGKVGQYDASDRGIVETTLR